MAESNTITSLFDDFDSLSEFEDVSTDARPFPTLMPYGEFIKSVLVYKLTGREEDAMVLFQDFTDQMARVQQDETWTWVVQWRTDEAPTTQRQLEAGTGRKKLCIVSSSPQTGEERKLKTKLAGPVAKPKKASPTYFGRPLLRDADILRALLDIVHAPSESLPNFINILYQWIDLMCGDGYALQCALREEIPNLWDFDHHSFTAQAAILLYKKSTSDKSVAEESNRMLYREKRFGLPPLAKAYHSRFTNIPSSKSKADEYFAACYKQRERALSLLAEFGLSPGQIHCYKTGQEEHPMDIVAPVSSREYRIQNMDMELPSYIRANLMGKWWKGMSEKWNEAHRTNDSLHETGNSTEPRMIDDAADTQVKNEPTSANLLSTPYRSAAFAAAQAYQAGLGSKRNWFVNQIPLVPLSVRAHLRSDIFSECWATKPNTNTGNPMLMILDEAELGVSHRDDNERVYDDGPGNEIAIKEEPEDDNNERELQLVLSNMNESSGVDTNSSSSQDDDGSDDEEDEEDYDSYSDEFDEEEDSQDEDYGNPQYDQTPALPPWPPGGPTDQNVSSWLSTLRNDQLMLLLKSVGLDPQTMTNMPGIGATGQMGSYDSAPLHIASASTDQQVAPVQAQNFPVQSVQNRHSGHVQRNRQPAQRPAPLNLNAAPRTITPTVVVTTPSGTGSSQLQLHIADPNHTEITPAFNRLAFEGNPLRSRRTVQSERLNEIEGATFVKNPQIATLQGLVERVGTDTPILMYFPQVMKAVRYGIPFDADAIMLGVLHPHTGEYEFSTAMFFDRRVRDAVLRGVATNEWSLSEALAPKSNFASYKPYRQYQECFVGPDPHRRAFSRLNHAFSLITSSGGMRDDVLTKRWRVTQGENRLGNRGSIWEGFAVGVDRKIHMTYRQRRGRTETPRPKLTDGIQELTLFEDDGNDDSGDERAREIEEAIEENLSDGEAGFEE